MSVKITYKNNISNYSIGKINNDNSKPLTFIYENTSARLEYLLQHVSCFYDYKLDDKNDFVKVLTKKERLNIDRQKEKLDLTLGGIKNMNGIPDALFIIDTNKEAIAVLDRYLSMR